MGMRLGFGLDWNEIESGMRLEEIEIGMRSKLGRGVQNQFTLCVKKSGVNFLCTKNRESACYQNQYSSRSRDPGSECGSVCENNGSQFAQDST